MGTMKTVLALAALLAAAVPATAASAPKSKDKKSSSPTLSTQREVRAALDALVDAFVAKDPAKFMSLVAEDYTGEAGILDTSIRDTFLKFIDMDIRCTPDNITADAKSKNVSIAATYSRSYTAVKTTRRIKKTGSAVLIFKRVGKSLKLYSSRGPFLFTLDDLP